MWVFAHVSPKYPHSSHPMSDSFESAAAAVKSLSERPSNDQLLQLYALYKQGTAGDVSGSKPGFFDIAGRAKFEAWEKIKGMSMDDAKAKYVELVRSLGGKV